jgi:hypothetical protein
VLSAVILVLSSLLYEIIAQSAEKTKKVIEDSNRNFIGWFNNGQIDSLITS